MMKLLPWIVAVLAIVGGVDVAFQSTNRASIQHVSDREKDNADKLTATKGDLDKLRREFEEFKREQSAGLIDTQKILNDLRNSRRPR